MTIPTPPPKSRSDSVIDRTLDPQAAADLADRLERGLSHAEAVRLLRDEHGIALSQSAVSRWASRRRRAKNDLTFAAVREQMKANGRQAASLRGEARRLHTLYEANVLMVTQALFAAQRNGDEAGVAHASRIFSTVLSAVTRVRRAENAQLLQAHRGLERAQTELMKADSELKKAQNEAAMADLERRKMEFDPVRAARDHAEALQEISRSKDLTQHEKILRAADLVFGRTAAKPASEEEAAPCGAGQ